MNRYRSMFGRRKTFFPVIHTLSREQVIESARIAADSGADGVFLINQNMTKAEIFDVAPYVRALTSWVGVNALGVMPSFVIDTSFTPRPVVDAVWSDSAGPEETQQFTRTRALEGWVHGIWFGGAAFKYRAHVDDKDIPALVGQLDLEAINVVTTTGEATGIVASLDKAMAFHAALDGHPLALASGIRPENVATYLPYVDAFLVATGIELDFGKLDPVKTRQLARTIARYNEDPEHD